MSALPTARPRNPVLPATEFIPDVEARVWQDGRLYFYGSYDIRGQAWYCSDQYHVYSTDDWVHWIDHGVSFRVADVPWVRDAALYAPDCVFANGRYHLFFCLSDGSEGVAAADSPAGPSILVAATQ